MIFCLLILPNQAQAQFYDKKESSLVLEAFASYDNRQHYTNAYTQASFDYGVKYQQWLFFFEGSPLSQYKFGLFLQEDDAIDPNIGNHISIFSEITLGRANIDNTNTNLDGINGESYGGILYRQRIWRDWVALATEWKMETGAQNSHEGLHGEFLITIRFLQNYQTKFYFTRLVRYADENYLDAWFGLPPELPNSEIRAGLYETQDIFALNTPLTEHQFLNIEIIRGNLLGTVTDSRAVLNPKDNGFRLVYGWRF